DERLRVEVGDDGPGFVPAPRSADAPLDSHWGLHLVEELADRWGVVAEPETLVWFELYTWLSPEVVHRSQPSHQNASA
ncbi:MAG TPA: ATP-binding protein, partial [Thermoleophilaceae bacterium]